MGLTYDGITYRSLEEQVRYDAEQVQALKQADVIINENLQTINTEIDGKLTKPTNPSAESAVTMLADGTVGTKPLSEIGGGGKLYRHTIIISDVTELPISIYCVFYTTYSRQMTQDDLLSVGYGVGAVNGAIHAGTARAYFDNSDGFTIFITGVVVSNGSATVLEKVITSGFTDTVTEL